MVFELERSARYSGEMVESGGRVTVLLVRAGEGVGVMVVVGVWLKVSARKSKVSKQKKSMPRGLVRFGGLEERELAEQNIK